MYLRRGNAYRVDEIGRTVRRVKFAIDRRPTISCVLTAIHFRETEGTILNVALQPLLLCR